MRNKSLNLSFACLIAATFISACASTPPLTLAALKNAEYQVEFPSTSPAKLINGNYEQEIEPGFSSKLRITILDQYALGDLNGDGISDAAVLLAENTGGSGVFIFLAAVVNDKGIPRHVASVELGDRVRINSVAISAGEITVDLVVHSPTDGLCCPTQPAIQKYKSQNDKLISVK